MSNIQIKRIYLPPESADGCRMLVDRLWPRGVSKQAAFLDEWNRVVAPSHELRRWFAHDPEKFDEFARCYREELAYQEEELARLAALAQKERLTLLCAARDAQHNHAVILREVLENKSKLT